MIEIENINVIEGVKKLENNSVNTIFSDPPYNLSAKYKIDKKTGHYILADGTKDFMSIWNAEGYLFWDEFFNQADRVLKYGGYMILFSIDRQQDFFTYYARRNGFEVCQSLYWYFISSFPKCADASKMIDNRQGLEREVIGKNPNRGKLQVKKGWNNNSMEYDNNLTKPASEMAEKYNGYKYGISPLKQTLETVLVFRKSPKHKSVLDDLFAYENGDETISPSIVDIEGGRVETSEKYKVNNYKINDTQFRKNKNKETNFAYEQSLSNGRYPAQMFADSQAKSIIDKQSGILKPTGRKNSIGNDYKQNNKIYGKYKGYKLSETHSHFDSGGASRILHTTDYESGEMDLLKYSPKVDGKERNIGLNGDKKQYSHDGREKPIENAYQRNDSQSENFHPTLKPISLTSHIANLFTLPIPQNWYVPFSGSGSEIIGIIKAAQKKGAEYSIIANEIDPEFYEISKKRVDYWKGVIKNNIDIKKLKPKTDNDNQLNLL
jgi:DNA modification methylase